MIKAIAEFILIAGVFFILFVMIECVLLEVVLRVRLDEHSISYKIAKVIGKKLYRIKDK